MNTRDNDPLHVAINATLAEVVTALPTPPAWYDGWMRLEPDTPEEERLRVYQAIRDSGCLPAEAGFYLVYWQIEDITCSEAETSLRELDVGMEAIEQAYELEHGEPWSPDEAPPEYAEVAEEYDAAWERLFLAKLEAFGEHAMAQQFRADPEAFDQRSEAGRQYFHGTDEPETWIDDLVEAVAGIMTDESGPGTLGSRYREEDGCWEILIYPTPVELVGGAEDGEIVAPGFSLDLDGLRSQFERVDDFSWQALGLNDSEGPHVSIEGIYQGHEVWLQVLAYAPEDEEPGTKIHTS
ncbi:MAG: hypothetical protein ACLQNE_03790 [Thermoguttaceae bacterium]